MTCHAMTDAITEGKPSTRKRSRHGAIGLSWANLTMTQAMVDAKDVARGAADMKMAVRKASSSRLKKKLR